MKNLWLKLSRSPYRSLSAPMFMQLAIPHTHVVLVAETSAPHHALTTTVVGGVAHTLVPYNYLTVTIH